MNTKFLLRPISESYWVIQNQFLAGEYPAYFDFNETNQRIDAFLEAGFNTFIDLTAPNEMKPYEKILRERAGYYGMDVNYQRFSIGDHRTPSRAGMILTLDAIDRALANNGKVYVHCWAGIGRTGTTVGCYLVRHGKSGDEALNQIASWWQDVPKHVYNPRSPETEGQISFVRNWKE